MNKITTAVIAAAGASTLFAASFLGFAKLNGVPLSTLPMLGGMFPADEKHAANEPASHSAPEPAKAPSSAAAAEVERGAAPEPSERESHGPIAPAKPSEPAPTLAHTDPPPPLKREARAGIFSVLDGDSLYTPEELRSLAESLRAKNRQADLRDAELDRREDLLTDRLTALDERRRTLESFAAQLDARERELVAREAEVARDASAPGGKAIPPGELSGFFGDGEVEVLVQRLAGFSAADVAQILSRLPPARARELLDALPNERWRECAEAYAKAVQKP